jgi:hypothetical protein
MFEGQSLAAFFGLFGHGMLLIVKKVETVLRGS